MFEYTVIDMYKSKIDSPVACVWLLGVTCNKSVSRRSSIYLASFLGPPLTHFYFLSERGESLEMRLASINSCCFTRVGIHFSVHTTHNCHTPLSPLATHSCVQVQRILVAKQHQTYIFVAVPDVRTGLVSR